MTVVDGGCPSETWSGLTFKGGFAGLVEVKSPEPLPIVALFCLSDMSFRCPDNFKIVTNFLKGELSEPKRERRRSVSTGVYH